MAAFHLGHPRPDAIARQPTPHEHDVAVQPRDAVAAVGERLDVELELLISLDGRGHGPSVAARNRSPAARAYDGRVPSVTFSVCSEPPRRTVRVTVSPGS